MSGQADIDMQDAPADNANPDLTAPLTPTDPPPGISVRPRERWDHRGVRETNCVKGTWAVRLAGGKTKICQAFNNLDAMAAYLYFDTEDDFVEFLRSEEVEAFAEQFFTLRKGVAPIPSSAVGPKT